MKCDNLVKYGMDDPTIGDDYEMYRVADVDAAITELKDRIHELESIPHTDNSAVIERLSNENERLVKCCKEYDSRQRIDERIKFNGSQQLRATKRALWLARALRARDKAFEYHFKNNVEMCAKWDNVHLMLMAKAEEYK